MLKKTFLPILVITGFFLNTSSIQSMEPPPSVENEKIGDPQNKKKFYYRARNLSGSLLMECPITYKSIEESLFEFEDEDDLQKKNYTFTPQLRSSNQHPESYEVYENFYQECKDKFSEFLSKKKNEAARELNFLMEWIHRNLIEHRVLRSEPIRLKALTEEESTLAKEEGTSKESTQVSENSKESSKKSRNGSGSEEEEG